MLIKSKEAVRLMFIKFYQFYKHKLLPSSSLVPDFKDKTLLFTNAGMNQFKNIFLGKDDIKYKRIITIQRCLRVSGIFNDFDNVGFTNRHNTFFEMMGNFSFNDYFKKHAILYAWKLLTDKNFFSLPKENFFVTVHISDIESYSIWLNDIGLPKDRILVLGKEKILSSNIIYDDNFWYLGKSNVCGTSTEIFYDIYHTRNNNFFSNLYLNKDNNQYLELYNIVFIQYYLNNIGQIYPLSKRFVDTGMGLERITSVLQGVSSNYEIDFFMDIKIFLSNKFNIRITSSNLYIFNILSDHLRSIIYLILDGILPTSDKQGYILKKFIRRVINYIKILGISTYFISRLIPDLIKILDIKKYDFDHIDIDFICHVINKEEIKFNNTLLKGTQIFKTFIKKIGVKKYLNSNFCFELYDTYGLPIYVIMDLCRFYNIKYNYQKFSYLLCLQKIRSRLNNLLDKTFFDILEKFSLMTRVTKWRYNFCITLIDLIIINNSSITKILSNNMYYCIVLRKTLFDIVNNMRDKNISIIIYNNNENNLFIVKKTMIINQCILHIGYLVKGSISMNDLVIIRII